MENWGLITYSELYLLYKEGVSALENKQLISLIVSHELAHNWFGNLVTPSWWTDLWLNEGFASYFMYLGADHVHPEFKHMEQFVIDKVQHVFSIDVKQLKNIPVLAKFIKEARDLHLELPRLVLFLGGLGRLGLHILLRLLFLFLVE